MTKLTDYRSTTITNEAELSLALKEEQIDISEIARFNAPGRQAAETDGSLRNQTLRYYNSNPDLLEAAISGIPAYVEKAAKEKKTLSMLIKEFAADEKSLTKQDGDDSVTFLENWLFHKYPLMDGIARLVRQDTNKPRRMIDHGLKELSIFRLIRAYDDWLNSQYGAKVDWSQLNNYLVE